MNNQPNAASSRPLSERVRLIVQDVAETFFSRPPARDPFAEAIAIVKGETARAIEVAHLRALSNRIRELESELAATREDLLSVEREVGVHWGKNRP